MKFGTVEITKGHKPGEFKTVAKSKNLRGILTYARKHGVAGVGVTKKQHGANVAFKFADDAWALVMFADFTVAVQWINARRSWDMQRTENGPHWSVWKCRG